MKFTEKLRSTAESYVKKIQQAEKAIADHQKNGINEYSAARYHEILFELQEKESEIKREGMAAVNAVIDEYKGELSRRYVAKGDELNAGDMALLSSGYQLKAADLAAMFDRYAPDNHTMLRAIVEYCENNKIEIDREYFGEAAKVAAADSLRTYALNCFHRPDYGMETEAYFAQIFPRELAGD